MKSEFIVQLANPERMYGKYYFDFMDSKLLNGEEKIIFLALKRFLDVKLDNGKVFPSIEAIQEITGWGKQKIIKYINSLVKKGVVKKIRQGLSKPNIYILSDYAAMWACDNLKDLTAIAENEGTKPLTPEEHIKALEKMGYKVEIKEKEPTSAPTKVTDVSTQSKFFSQPDNTTDFQESQDLEKYTLNQIKELFSYEAMIHDYPDEQEHIDSVMDILHTTLNTSKKTIRIAGTDKPTMIVIGKLMKLNNESIMYAIKKFKEQTERIKNPTSYMLTILYMAPEQFHLDITNQVQHDFF